MDDATALKRLKLLLQEDGALRIINHFHACGDDLMTDDMMARSGDTQRVATCEAYAETFGHKKGMPGGYRDPGHYLLHDVKRIEESPNKPGLYTAYADDELGTQCSGRPAALLARLTEHES